MQRQTEETLSVVDANRAETVTDLESDCVNVSRVVRVGRVPDKERTVRLVLQQCLGLLHSDVAIVIAAGGESLDGLQETGVLSVKGSRHVDRDLHVVVGQKIKNSKV